MFNKLSNTAAEKFTAVWKGGKQLFSKAVDFVKKNKHEIIGLGVVALATLVAVHGGGIKDGHLLQSLQTMVGTSVAVGSGILTAIAHSGKKEAARVAKIVGVSRE